MHKIEEKLNLGKLATFEVNKKYPIYNWFYYKEGFSRELVMHLLHKFNVTNTKLVLDPFCGVGTTLLACKEAGINTIGFDSNPIAGFVSRAKLMEYNINELKESTKHIFSLEPNNMKYKIKIPIMKDAFLKNTLKDVIFYKKKIKELDYEPRIFFTLALMNATMRCSFVFKDGAVLKIKKRPLPKLKDEFKHQIKKMIKDLEKTNFKKTIHRIDERDSKSMDLDNNVVDAVITSPPYLNKKEYTKIYFIEEELFLNNKNKEFIEFGKTDSTRVNKILNNFSINQEARQYFYDMYFVIREMHRVCKPSAKLALIIGNGCFSEAVVESDIILSSIAEDIGFKINGIECISKRWCTKERTKKVGIARESILYWEK